MPSPRDRLDVTSVVVCAAAGVLPGGFAGLALGAVLLPESMLWCALGGAFLGAVIGPFVGYWWLRRLRRAPRRDRAELRRTRRRDGRDVDVPDGPPSVSLH